MVQHLRSLAALTDNASSVPKAHIRQLINYSLPFQFQVTPVPVPVLTPSSGLLAYHVSTWCVYIHTYMQLLIRQDFKKLIYFLNPPIIKFLN